MMTPEEAEDLIPIKRTDEDPITHLLAYASPTTRRMVHFNKLDYYAVPGMPIRYKTPQWLHFHVGLFAGRLYFEPDEYDAITTFLYCNSKSPVYEPKRPRAKKQELADRNSAHPSIASDRLTFLQEWITVRRKGQEFMQTPMGYVCGRKPLTAKHPFFSITNDVSTATVSTGSLDEDITQSICNSDSDSCNSSEVAFSGFGIDLTGNGSRNTAGAWGWRSMATAVIGRYLS